RPPTDCGLRIADSSIADCGLRIADSSIADCGLRIADFRFQQSDGSFDCSLVRSLRLHLTFTIPQQCGYDTPLTIPKTGNTQSAIRGFRAAAASARRRGRGKAPATELRRVGAARWLYRFRRSTQ